MTFACWFFTFIHPMGEPILTWGRLVFLGIAEC
jgi:hypothetical protein